MGRAFSLGVTLSAPAVVMSTILGWTLPVTVFVICIPMILYTSFGGVQAVAWTDVKQMFIIVGGLLAAVVVLIVSLPHGVSLGQAIHLAGATGRMQAIDLRFDLRERYTFWSGMIGGLFLMLSYFGCDQSQVQRYLTAKSVDEARHSLLMSAFVKIPLQLLILLTGVLVFVFYLFQAPPMLFNRTYDAQVQAGPRATEYRALEESFGRAFGDRRAAADARRSRGVSGERRARARHPQSRRGHRPRDERRSALHRRQLRVSNLHHDPDADGSRGIDDCGDLRGGDVGERGRVERPRDRHDHRLLSASLREGGERCALLGASKLATVAWGLFACVVAMYAANQGSLIEVVNRYGSFFYGSLLGVFILAILTKRTTAAGAFWGLIAGMTVVLIVAFTTPIEFLWHNLIGAVVVVVVGLAISSAKRPDAAPAMPE